MRGGHLNPNLFAGIPPDLPQERIDELAASANVRIERIVSRTHASPDGFWYDQLFVKEPGTLDPMPWHHDLPYWPFRGSQVCSVWLAIEDVTGRSHADA